MRCIKSLGLLAAVAAALMACAGSASAGNFTNPKNTVWTGEIHAISGEITFHGVGTLTCKSSTIKASVSSHGSGVTGAGSVSSLIFNECNQHVSVFSGGTLEIHTHPADSAGGTYGIVTSSGAVIAVVYTGLGITCEYSTKNTELGTLTTSTHRDYTGDFETTATIHGDGVIPRTGGSIFCGSSGEVTGTITVTTPDYLDYD